ncbi:MULTISPECIES: hypothetical protein [Kitasatospora]|uniref:Uncharacterized protein n=2 Tax=Kitasatospora TaxID=2063 RepID=A0ABT1J2E2_9ACTN|nr:hypothetical protein [Kitasatospora paracochleata]MCP2310901.1 hypothetical protein [Kitasatospora paracochleata]
MADRLFDSMDLRQAVEIDDLEPVELGEPELSAVLDGSNIVYTAAVPFTGSKELLLARPETQDGRTNLRSMGLTGSVQDGSVHLQSRPRDHATASSNDGETWLGLQLNNLRTVVRDLNRAVAERKRVRAHKAELDAADLAAAEEKVRAINEEFQARKKTT